MELDHQQPPGGVDYYQVLGVGQNATQAEIRKNYYSKAREVNPDKNLDDPNAKQNFQTLGEAYQVLSNPGLRERYHHYGRSSISQDFIVNPLEIFNMHFGGLLFEDYVGQFLIAESKSLSEASNEGQTLSRQKLLDFQKDREKILAVKLKERLSHYENGGDRRDRNFKSFAEAEACKLSKTAHGFEILHTIGSVYTRQSEKANEKTPLGSFVGAAGDWLGRVRTHITAAQGAIAVIQMQWQIQSGELVGDMETLKTDMIKSLWKINSADIETTLTRVCQTVLQDKTAQRAPTTVRADGLKILGKVFKDYSTSSTREGEPPLRIEMHKDAGSSSEGQPQSEIDVPNQHSYIDLDTKTSKTAECVYPSPGEDKHKR